MTRRRFESDYAADLIVSGRKEGDEPSPVVSNFRERALDESLGRQIRRVGEAEQGDIQLRWDSLGAVCEGRRRDGTTIRAARVDRRLLGDAMRAALAELLDITDSPRESGTKEHA